MQGLKEQNLADALVLLHFHLGSQIPDIQILKQAVKEITQIYAQLLKRGVPLQYLDVGGGLGVNYGTGYSTENEGINYTLQEYANAVVYSVKEVCDDEGVVHPIIVSESGRAITAHHSVLIVEALGTYRKDLIADDYAPAEDANTTVRELYEVLTRVRGPGRRAGKRPLSESGRGLSRCRRETPGGRHPVHPGLPADRGEGPRRAALLVGLQGHPGAGAGHRAGGRARRAQGAQ